MKAIILSAGQGKRLLPLTRDCPKCLLPVDSQTTVLRWQLDQLADAGVTRVSVVVGFAADKVEAEIARYNGPLRVETIFNPFYSVADNLSSVWLARSEMKEDFILLNGDTVFTSSVAARLMNQAKDPVTLTIARKENYDADDMKVSLLNGRLRRVGKTLQPGIVNGESIGMMMFRGPGKALFEGAVESAMKGPDGLKVWYLSVIDQMASKAYIGTVEAAQDEWGEIDFAEDLESVQRKLTSWNKTDNARVAVSV